MNGETDRPRILLATDFSKWALRAEEYACCLAATWRATLTVLTVLEFPPGMNPEYPVNQVYLGELMKAGAKQLVELKARASARGVSLHTRIATGIPCEEAHERKVTACAVPHEGKALSINARLLHNPLGNRNQIILAPGK